MEMNGNGQYFSDEEEFEEDTPEESLPPPRQDSPFNPRSPIGNGTCPAPTLPIKIARHPQVESLQSESRRSRSRSPSQERFHLANGSRENGNHRSTRTPPPSSSRGSNRVTMMVKRPSSTASTLSNGQLLAHTASGYSFKFYFILSLLSVSLYSVYHLHSTVHELKSDITLMMSDHQLQLINLKSDLLHEFRKREVIYISELDDLRAEMSTMTAEVSKLMKRITIKQMQTETSIEARQAEAGEVQTDYSSQLIKPEASLTLDTGTSELEKINSFRDFIKSLRSGMRAQPRETWIEIYSSIVSTFSPTSARPAAIVFLIPPHLQYTQFPSCLARKLGNEVNYIFNGNRNTGLKELSPLGLLESSSVSQIHDELKLYFDREGGKGVLIHNLEQLWKYEVLMIFHAFCDNVEAYEKQATFIFTVHVPEVVYDRLEWAEFNGQRITHDTLHGAWESVLSLDKRSALIARVAVNPILIRDGDSCL